MYYLDRSLCLSGDNGLFECSICMGIVINPVECNNPACSTLFCKKCVKNIKFCPKKCGPQLFNTQ